MKDHIARRIEIGIARYWPDIERIRRETGATAAEVHDVVDHILAIEDQPRHEHDCAKHPPGSTLCYDEHVCRCPDCREAVRRRAEDVRDSAPWPVKAHRLYVRLKKAGEPIPWSVRDGQRQYDRERKERAS